MTTVAATAIAGHVTTGASMLLFLLIADTGSCCSCCSLRLQGTERYPKVCQRGPHDDDDQHAVLYNSIAC